MMKTLILLTTLSLLAAGCTKEEGVEAGENQPEVTETPPTGTETPAVDTEAKVYDTICGCALEEVGHCGNYVKVDGKFVELVHPSLGAMEWCGKGEAGAQAKLAGGMTDGKFVATTYEAVG